MITIAGGGGGEVLSIEPRIRRRQQQECKHHHVEVDDTAASLTCLDCKAELDPWWYLRNMAHHDDLWEARHNAQKKEMADQIAQHEAWLAKANETIQKYNAEIQHLVDVKNRLSNEYVDGIRVGSLARRLRRRQVPK